MAPLLCDFPNRGEIRRNGSAEQTMLQRLRAHTSGWIAKIILALLVFAFSFFGIQSYFMTRTDTSAARVGDLEVSQQDFQNRMNDVRRRAQQQMAEVDPALFNTPEFKKNILDALIDEQLLVKTNQDLGIAVTDDMVANAIADVPAFQLNGRFDADTYAAVLGQQGMTPLGFEQQIRQQLAMQVLPQAVADTALAPRSEIDAYLRLRDQTRNVRYLELPEVEPANSEVTDAEIEAWYKAHTDDFMTPEQVALEYIEVKASDLETDVVPSEEALRERYEQEKSRFVSPEQRLASHILVAVAANASADQHKQALAEAAAIRAKLEAGADFAELATAQSDDLGSKRQGGDLGWIEKGLTNPAFEEALFALDKGEVSSPVLSSEGYHIIELRDIRQGGAQAFAEVRDELTTELLDSERERRFSDVAGRMTDLIYADPGSLQGAAKTLDLEVQRTGLFGREGGAGIAANPAVVEIAFSDQVLSRGMNSDPITLGVNDVVVVRLAEHKPATPKPLADVSDDIRQRILAKREADAAADQAKAMLAQLAAGTTLDQLATKQNLGVTTRPALVRRAPDVPPALGTAIFKMPQPGPDAPSRTMVDLGQGRYVVVELLAVQPGDPAKVSKDERDSIATQLQQLHAAAAQRAMMDALRRNTEVTISEDSTSSN